MKPLFALLLLLAATRSSADDPLRWTPLPPIPSALGVAGPFTGVHESTLLVAGGANFPEPVWETDKAWHDTIYAYPLDRRGAAWEAVGSLPRPLGYGTTVSLPEGVLCIGGNDAEGLYADVFLLSWKDGEVLREDLPSLPEPLCYTSAARVGDHVYVAGGQTGPGLETATRTFLRFDWSKRGAPDTQWEAMPPWPMAERAFAHLVAVPGTEVPGTTVPGTGSTRLFLLGGRHLDEDGEVEFLADLWEFEGADIRPSWSRKADLPAPLAAGTVGALPSQRIVTLAGADGSLFATADELKDAHPGFPKRSWIYDGKSDEWSEGGLLPQNQVTTEAVPWRDGFLLASGEIRPRVRTPDAWRIEVVEVGPSRLDGKWLVVVLALGIPLSILLAWKSRKRRSLGESSFR